MLIHKFESIYSQTPKGDRGCSCSYRWWLAVFVFASSWLSALSLLAASPPPGTVIDNQATGSFTDPTDNTEKQIESNIVRVEIAEVAGITITGIATEEAPSNVNGAGANQNDGNVNPNDVVYFIYRITNVGNDPSQIFIPGAPSAIAGGSQQGNIEIIEYDPDGTGATAASDLRDAPIEVPNAGISTGDPNALDLPNGSIPAEGTVTIRVPVKLSPGLSEGSTVAVTMGDTGDNDNSAATQNQIFSAGTNDVYTQDNPDGTTGETDGNPLNGDTTNHRQEASYKQVVTVTLTTAALDYGDAPDTYGTDSTAGNSSNSSDPLGASHVIASNLFLGATVPDAETNGFVDGTDDNGDATDDDALNGTGTGNGDDEDNFTLPNLTSGDTTYTIPAANITATNTTNQSAILHAWIDFNNSGTFENNEHASVTVNNATNGGNPAGGLTWNNINVGAVGNTYARFRLTTDSSITAATPGGNAANGEVEDYQIAIANESQTIEETASCVNLGGTLSSNNIFTPFDNGTFGTENGQPNQSPPDNADPYPGAVIGGEYKNFYNIDHGNYGYVANYVQRRNTFQHDNISDPVYGVTGRFFASDPDTDTPTLTATLSGLTPNQFYQYSFWAANSEPNSPSNNNVDVNINGQKVYSTGELPAFPDTLQWKKHTVSFTNGASTSITIDLESTKTGAPGNDFYLDNIELRDCNFTVDYGDAPTSYGDAIQTTIPNTPTIYLGAVAPDGENATPLGGDNGVGADGDDDANSGIDDEDAFVTLSDIPTTGSYDLNNIPVNNTSGEDVTLHAWIDFDRDGQFSASEYQSVTVANGETTADLSWTVPNNTTLGNTYARFRITPDVLLTDDPNTADVDERSKDAAVNGEVEDYQIAIAPASLCPAAKADLWFANDESGSVDSAEFNNALDFIYQISDGFIYDDNTGMKAGITGWTDLVNSTEIVIPITESFGDPGDSGLFSTGNITLNSNSQGIRELYSSKQNSSPGTRLDRATNYLADLITAGNGKRPNTPQVAVILTDADRNFIENENEGGGFDWVSQANTLRNAGAEIVLILIDEAATSYNTNSDSRFIINRVVGSNGRVITVPNYAQAADSTQSYIEEVSQAICDLSTPVASDPGLLLVKRITAINPGQTDEIQFNDFVDDPNTTNDNHPRWPDSDEDPSSNTNLYLRGVLNGGRIKPGDEVEYTIYFLSNGDEAAEEVNICDVVPDHLTFVKDAYGGETGIALGYDPDMVRTDPNKFLSNLLNDDAGDFYGADTAPPANLCKKVELINNSATANGSNNSNGAVNSDYRLVTVDGSNNNNGAIIVRPATSLPSAISPGQPAGSYGFIRFRGKVK